MICKKTITDAFNAWLACEQQAEVAATQLSTAWEAHPQQPHPELFERAGSLRSCANRLHDELLAALDAIDAPH